MAQPSKKEKIVTGEQEPVVNPANDKTVGDGVKEDMKNDPLAPVDPRLRKPGNDPLQANQDPLNGVNE